MENKIQERYFVKMKWKQNALNINDKENDIAYF